MNRCRSGNKNEATARLRRRTGIYSAGIDLRLVLLSLRRESPSAVFRPKDTSTAGSRSGEPASGTAGMGGRACPSVWLSRTLRDGPSCPSTR